MEKYCLHRYQPYQLVNLETESNFTHGANTTHSVTLGELAWWISGCTEDTWLTMIPVMCMVVTSPHYLMKLIRSNRGHVAQSRTWLGIARLMCPAMLCLLAAVQVVHHLLLSHSTPSQIIASTLVFFTWLISCGVQEAERHAGVVSSVCLFIWGLLWLPKVIFSLVTVLLWSPSSHLVYLYKSTVFLSICFIIIYIVLTCIKDKIHFQSSKNHCPLLTASALSILFIWWPVSLVKKGFKKTLDLHDIWDLMPQFNIHYLVTKVLYSWKTQQNRNYSLTFVDDVNEDAVSTAKDEFSSPQSHLAIPSLLKALLSISWTNYVIGAVMQILETACLFTNPLILRRLIQFVQSADMPWWEGYLLALAMFLVSGVQIIIHEQYVLHYLFTGTKVRGSLMAMVYRKSLRLSSGARQSTTVGEIVNLMAVDSVHYLEMMNIINILCRTPVHVGLALYLLWGIIGPSVLAGFFSLVLVMPLHMVIVKINKRLQSKQMQQKDARVKLTNEMLTGIKVLKMYAWENSYEAIMRDIRGKEIRTYKLSILVNTLYVVVVYLSHSLVGLITFTVYVLSSPDHILTAEKAFVSLSLFLLIKAPIHQLPTAIGSAVQLYVSHHRLWSFFTRDDLQYERHTHDSKGDRPTGAIQVHGASFGWQKEKDPYLHRITVNISPGSLVAVVGTVGAGKSSLLSAMLGNMHKCSGDLIIKGEIAYVPQQSWIQQTTLKNNVTFNRPVNNKQYDRCVTVCALKPDLAVLPYKGDTIIGEKGITLSGGQKLRVSLARAVYSQADIYVLDDPLSAVDSHVAKQLFSQIIGPKGILKEKTRVLVTHNLSVLPHVDYIILMEKGVITEEGTYEELMSRRGIIYQTANTYHQAHVTDESNSNPRSDNATESTSADTDEDEDVMVTPEDVIAATCVSKNKSCKSAGAIEDSDDTENATEKDDLVKDEEISKGKVKGSVYRMYFSAVGWLAVIITISIAVARRGLEVFSLFWLSWWSDHMGRSQDAGDYNQRNVTVSILSNVTEASVLSTTQPENQTYWLWVYALLGVLQTVLAGIEHAAFMWNGLKSSTCQHNLLVQRMLHAKMEFFERTPLGRILNRFSSDVAIMDTLVPDLAHRSTSQLLGVLGAILVMFLTTPFSMIVWAAMTVIYVLVQWAFLSTQRQLLRLISTTKSPVFSHFSETLSGVSTIRAYNQMEIFTTESDSRIEQLAAVYIPTFSNNRWLGVILCFIGNVSTFSAALFAVANRATITPAVAGLCLSQAMTISESLSFMVKNIGRLESNLVSVERIKTYTEVEQEAPYTIPGCRPSLNWPAEGHIQMQGYSTRYRRGVDTVLNNINCTIYPSEKVGVVGRTGAGKSSLTLALFRLLEPSQGSITIDGIDITTIGLHDLRSKITIIPQDPVLFSGTLRMNLDPFGIHTEDKLWECLEQSHLKNFVSSLTLRLDYECSEGGENLSVGQRQLVCLARALLRHTKILVLDEATAACDVETDDLIQKTLKRYFSDCTVITIAHRINTIMDYDRVLVLDAGRLQELGNPSTLLQDKTSYFYRLVKESGLQ